MQTYISDSPKEKNYQELLQEVNYNSDYPFWMWLQENRKKVDSKNLIDGKEYIYLSSGKEPRKVVVIKEGSNTRIKSSKPHKNAFGKNVYSLDMILKEHFGDFYEMSNKKENGQDGGKRKSKKTMKARKHKKGTYRKRR